MRTLSTLYQMEVRELLDKQPYTSHGGNTHVRVTSKSVSYYVSRGGHLYKETWISLTLATTPMSKEHQVLERAFVDLRCLTSKPILT